MTRVTVWTEFLHEKEDDAVLAIYPDGIHGQIASFLEKAGIEAGTATL
ncbi:trehalose utilization protein ThuA, partial [Listeria monocytogenes]|nr:trehalose utilization protein ThuA [Listeria monocytogenes]